MRSKDVEGMWVWDVNKMKFTELLGSKETKSSVTHLKYSLKSDDIVENKFWHKHWEILNTEKRNVWKMNERCYYNWEKISYIILVKF